MYQYFRLLSIPVLFLSSGILLAVAVYFLNTSYFDFSETIIAIYHLQEKAEIFTSQYLTEFRYEILKFTLIALAFFSPLVALYTYLNLELLYFSLKQFILFVRGLYFNLKSSYTNLTSTQKLYFKSYVLSITAVRVFLLFRYPVHIDEAFSYVFMVSKGMLVTLTYYPGPNNHIGYLISCVLADVIFSEPMLAIRIPVLLLSTFTSIFLFAVIKKYLNFNIALVASCLFSFSEYGLFYSVHGRGYELMIICFIIASISLIKIINIGSKYYFIVFIGASVLGFYTIPVFLYPFASIMLFALIYSLTEKQTRKVRWLFATGMIVFLGSLFMYMPVLFASGINALTGNKWVSKMNFDLFLEQFPFYLADTPGTFYSLDIYGTWITLLNFTFWLIVAFKPTLFEKEFNDIKKLKHTGVFLTCLYISPPIFLFVQQVLPGARIWLYLSLAEYISIVWAISLIYKKYKTSRPAHKKSAYNPEDNPESLPVNYKSFSKSSTQLKVILVLLIGYISFMTYYTGWVTVKREPIYQQQAILNKQIIDDEAQIVYVNQDLYNVFLRYEALRAHKNIFVEANNPEEREYYDFIVLRQNSAFPESLNKNLYKLFYTDEFVVAYKRIKDISDIKDY
ncbi:glycosyltransferase family 39 protein [Chondrinema litorale]|uniref:glycosyltransferase family 39 protein n=1 Tax=Chondrinema litorale TaxID=2994555 RepID=UPI002542897B|nr:glycosyltransferase family 39 protein [Chondrinema litorale]UZR94688.1 glycosyltransferase family 39 protein [Chondrinema litorale]